MSAQDLTGFRPSQFMMAAQQRDFLDTITILQCSFWCKFRARTLYETQWHDVQILTDPGTGQGTFLVPEAPGTLFKFYYLRVTVHSIFPCMPLSHQDTKKLHSVKEVKIPLALQVQTNTIEAPFLPPCMYAG